jgi:hypothetical protein
MFNAKPIILTAMIIAATPFLAPPAAARDSVRTTASASGLSVLGSAMLVGESYKLVENTAATSGRLVVAALEPVGDSVRITLKAADQGVQASATASVVVARDASIALGAVVSATAEATGYALVTAGRIVAFVPNELGRALLRQERSRYASVR